MYARDSETDSVMETKVSKGDCHTVKCTGSDRRGLGAVTDLGIPKVI